MIERRPIVVWRVHDITSALTDGTTLPTRLFLSFGMLMMAVGFLTNQASWLANPAFANLNQVLAFKHWAWAYGIGGLLGLWRVLVRTPMVWAAWVINAYIFGVWSVTFMVRFWEVGTASLASIHTMCYAMSLFVLLRTEATSRDRETA